MATQSGITFIDNRGPKKYQFLQRRPYRSLIGPQRGAELFVGGRRSLDEGERVR